MAVQAGVDPNYDAHHVKAITDRAIAFLKRQRQRPFFCYVAHNSIHRPNMEYTPRMLKYADKPDACNRLGNNPVHGAMVETLDKNVGRLLRSIHDLDLDQNTVVIFYSDNGCMYGRRGRNPFYGAKADLYEGGIRMPLIVRWPGVVQPGSTCHELVSSIDFLPTFAQLAGVKVSIPELDGISIVPALKQAAPLGRTTLYWHYPHYHAQGIAPEGAIRDGKYKLIEWFEKSIEGPKTPGALALYDLEKDPGERHNLAAQMPAKTHALYEKLKTWRASVDAQNMTRNPEYDPARARQKR